VSSSRAGVGIAIIILAISIGAVAGALILPRIFGSRRIGVPVVGAPQDHWDIIENLEIIEVGSQGGRFLLEPLCVDHGIKEYGRDMPLSVFHTGEGYYQSTWLFHRHGDTEACLTIWGPGENGGYDLEASRLVGTKLEIWYDHELIRTMPKLTGGDLSSCMLGFVWFAVSLE